MVLVTQAGLAWALLLCPVGAQSGAMFTAGYKGRLYIYSPVCEALPSLVYTLSFDARFGPFLWYDG